MINRLGIISRPCSSFFLLIARGVTPQNKRAVRNALVNLIFHSKVTISFQPDLLRYLEIEQCNLARLPTGLGELNERWICIKGALLSWWTVKKIIQCSIQLYLVLYQSVVVIGIEY